MGSLGPTPEHGAESSRGGTPNEALGTFVAFLGVVKTQ